MDGKHLRHCLLTLVGVLALSATTQAASWLDANAHNGVSIFIQGSYGFIPAGTLPSPGTPGLIDDSGSLFLDTEISGGPDRDGTTEALSLALPVLTPADLGGSGTGTVLGNATSTIHFGGPGSDDRIEIAFSGTASALSALTSSSTNADAVVGFSGSIQFSIDPIIFPPETRVGNLVLDPLPDPGSLGMLTVSWADYSHGSLTPVVTDLGGSPGASLLPLLAGHAYSLDYSYGIQVPFGTDPPFSLAITASVTAVPLPPAAWLLGCALPLLLFSRRRDRPPA